MDIDRALIVYASRHGQTEAIALELAEVLRQAEVDTDCVDTHTAEALPWDGYQLIVLGAPIYLRHHAPALVRSLLRHRRLLDGVPSAMFSVSLSAASERTRPAAMAVVDGLLSATHWRPQLVATLGGALNYTQYSWPLRQVMRLISARTGGPTDTTRDHDLTDWREVRLFGEELATLAHSAGREHVQSHTHRRRPLATLKNTLVPALLASVSMGVERLIFRVERMAPRRDRD